MRYTMGELAEIIDGDRGKNYPQQSEFMPEGYCLFLNTGNVTVSGFSFENNQFISKEKSDLLRKGKLKRRDIVYTTRGTVGNVGFFSENVPYEHMRINSGMVILRPNESIVCTEFLYQILKNSDYRLYFQQYCTGSAQPQLPIKNLSKIELDIPPLEGQYQIANILSAYDNLIENNQKQIKLLEEVAQRLYKEWFVDLRFPGYEHTTIVDGIPEGWHRGCLGELININYGKDHKKAPNPGNIPVYGSGGVMRECDSFLYEGESVLVPRKGSLNNIMYVDERFWTVDTMFFTTPKVPEIILFVYFFLKSYDMYAMNIGAAVPSMTVKILNSMDVLVPIDGLLHEYNRYVRTLFQKRKILEQQQRNLIEARDRLLPKLMNGELEV